MVECKHGMMCTCTTCPGCEDQPSICDECEGSEQEVMLFCSEGKSKGAVRGESKKGTLQKMVTTTTKEEGK